MKLIVVHWQIFDYWLIVRHPSYTPETPSRVRVNIPSPIPERS